MACAGCPWRRYLDILEFDLQGIMKRNMFIFLLWERARKYKAEFRGRIGHEFKILCEVEMFWPRRILLRQMRAFYVFGSWFTWWNKSRKCGRGPFLVFLVEDADPVWCKRHDTRGRELLVDDRIYQMKQELRRMTGHSNIVHSSVTLEETADEVRTLFGCTPEELAAEKRLPPADELERMLAEGIMKPIGEGMRRVCWRIPGYGMCLKAYRKDDEILAAGKLDGVRRSVAREVRRYRHDEVHNTSCREWYYHQELRATLPKELLAIFPERVERIYLPAYGWCLAETELVNFDGSPVRQVTEEIIRVGTAGTPYADIGRFRALRKALPPFFAALASAAVRFYDPPNVLVQWTGPDTFRLRIADFEPEARTLIALDRWFDVFARLKCRRRYGRFLRTLGLKPKW